MQPTHHLPDHDLDAQVRDALAMTEAELDLSRERSRYAAAFDLDDAIAAEVAASRPRRRTMRSRRSALAVVGSLAAAVLVAGALAPGSHHKDGSQATAPFIAGNASAAEVLERAARRLLVSGEQVGGSGPAWHAVSHGSDGGIWESWFDSDAGHARWAMYQAAQQDVPLGVGSRTTDFPASYYVLDIAANGDGTIRQYIHDGDVWKPQEGGAQMNGSSQDGTASIISGIEVEALAWLRAVDEADAPSELHAANERFVERTHMWFAPPAADPTLGGERAAARAMQLTYLLRVARLQPEAVAQLYRDVIDVDDLVRLEDGRVDGRAVARLRLFDPPKGPGGEQLASVLLLDMETGEPIGMEAENGSARDLFASPRRTGAVGSDAESCGTGDRPPCELLRGEGPVAAAADRIAAKMGQPLDVTPGAAGDGDSVAAVAEQPSVGSAPSTVNAAAAAVAPSDGQVH